MNNTVLNEICRELGFHCEKNKITISKNWIIIKSLTQSTGLSGDMCQTNSVRECCMLSMSRKEYIKAIHKPSEVFLS